jgi:polysaccharide pyruvyl transferase WcaK-like protein
MFKFHVFWWTMKREDGKDNFGDILTKYIVERLSNNKIIKVAHPSMRRYKYFLKHYFVIGSILELANKNSIVWGSGIIREKQIVDKAKFLAVRGPRTKKRLEELGYSVNDVFGDPAILLPNIYKSKANKKFKIGIIPHIIHYEDVLNKLQEDERLTVINLLTDNIEKTLDQILECEYVISTSLHGIIVSHAYNIPALWVKYDKELAGDNVKFYDYLESLEIIYEQEFYLNSQNLSFDFLSKLLESNLKILLPDNDLLEYRKKELLKSCPFNKTFVRRFFL